ncbi:MAG: bacteriorhodopsin [Flavobacteriales bacterium]|nr:bacteriorhodopsin [Flavobacteriales bacterium]
MTNLFLPLVAKMDPTDYVGFTFFVGCMAMMAASAFFFLSMNSFDRKWKTSILVSGLITFIAAVHYYYMRDYWASSLVVEDGVITGSDSPTFFRYVDWILTVPLMCVEFYLILKVAGAKKNLMWTLIGASVVMLVTGYLGEAVYPGNAALWGFISGAAYFYIVYLIMFGEAKDLATKAGGNVLSAHNMLVKFVLIGWAIYPLGYMIGTADGQWYSFMGDIGLDMNVVYNIGDAINKIGFGLVVYSLAVASTSKEAA